MAAQKINVLRRQWIIVKSKLLLSTGEREQIKRSIMHDLESEGIAVIGGTLDVTVVDRDTAIAVEEEDGNN